MYEKEYRMTNWYYFSIEKCPDIHVTHYYFSTFLMFTKEESSRIRHEFWTTFGRYMNPVLSAEGMKINWVNYHTRLKDVYFRMDAGAKSALIAITMEHRDPAIQELFFEQFLQFKTLLHTELGEEWQWELHATVAGKVLSRIYKEVPGVSILNKEHWADLITFFKPRIIALDNFWENARYSFDGLR
jgi:hypothetical protein